MINSYRQYLIAGEQAGLRYSLGTPRRTALGGAGLHLGGRAGSSLEFRDHREYQPGDDPRRIDWGAFARADRLIVKLYREEVSPHLDLVIDGSRSMALEGSAKPEAALGLAALFATAAANAGFSHCAWLAREGCKRVDSGTGRPATWGGIEFDYRGHPSDSLARLAPAWRRQGLRVLISDLLWLGEPLLLLQHLAQGAAGAVVVQVLARADVEPPERGNVRLVDSETGLMREIFVDGAAVERYRDGLARHRQNWQTACRQVGALLVSLVAEEVVGDWRLDELIAAEVLKVGYSQ